MPSVLPRTDSVSVARAPAGGQLQHDPAGALRRAEVDLDPLREGVVRALPVGGLVAVGHVARRVDVGVAGLAGRLAGGEVGARTVPAPVPDSATVVGLFVALLVTVSVPVRVPEAVGRKLTLTVQDAPAAIDVPQVLVCGKSPRDRDARDRGRRGAGVGAP